MHDAQRLEEAKQVLTHLANGYNPLDGTPLEQNHFLHHPRVIRPLYYLLQHLNKREMKPRSLVITKEQLMQVILPEGEIGINTFCRYVNEQLDLTMSKKLTYKPIYDKLKQLEILDEVETEDGKKRTTVNAQSASYGIKEIQRTFNGRTYEQVVFDDLGKEFLLNNLLKLLSIDEEPVLEKA